MQDSDEREIVLSDGRTLAYCEGGDLSSRRVFVFFFHGVFGRGDTSPPLSENTTENVKNPIVFS